jgi:hypothetical protein
VLLFSIFIRIFANNYSAFAEFSTTLSRIAEKPKTKSPITDEVIGLFGLYAVQQNRLVSMFFALPYYKKIIPIIFFIVFQLVKSRARGFRNITNFMNLIYHLGNDFVYNFH